MQKRKVLKEFSKRIRKTYNTLDKEEKEILDELIGFDNYV